MAKRCKHARVAIIEMAEEVHVYYFEGGELRSSTAETGDILPKVEVECQECKRIWHYTHRHMPKWVAALLATL